MNLFDAIAHRRSVRSFLDKPIEREKLVSIFSAVRLAPSARNAQEWRFILVTDPDLREKVAVAGGQPFLRQCPVIVAACAETDKRVMRCGEPAYPIDVAIAIDRFNDVVDWKIEAVERRWAGLRSFAPDRLPVYGFDRQVPGFFWFAGQGGFGIQTAPAAARLGAQLLLGLGADDLTASIDPAVYDPKRFA